MYVSELVRWVYILPRPTMLPRNAARPAVRFRMSNPDTASCGSKSINTLDAYVIRLFKWRTKREPVKFERTHAVVCSDVGIVAMRTFIEMTADSFNVLRLVLLRTLTRTSVYFERKINSNSG